MPYGRIDAIDNDFVARAVALLSAQIRFFIGQHGKCALGLSGGSTPKPIYELLGQDTEIDWSAVHVFLVDDRFIDPSDSKSNQFLIRESLLKYADIPESNLCFPRIDLPLPVSATDYEDRLHIMLDGQTADIVTLGIGEDGHIASLFPPLEDDAFEEADVLVTTTDKFDVRIRLSVSLPFLTKVKLPVFLLQGEKKKALWEEMLAADVNLRRWPAQAVLATERAMAVIG